MSFKLLLVLLAVAFCGKLQNTFIVPNDQSQVSMPVKVGEPFSIEIEGNPTTGYLWLLSKPSNSLKALNVDGDGKGEYTPQKVAKGFAGAGGKFNFNFVAPAVTNELIALEFEYRRPWESEPIKKVVVKVHVN